MRQNFTSQMSTFTPASGKKKAPSQRGEGARGLSGWLTNGLKGKPPWGWGG